MIAIPVEERIAWALLSNPSSLRLSIRDRDGQSHICGPAKNDIVELGLGLVSRVDEWHLPVWNKGCIPEKRRYWEEEAKEKAEAKARAEAKR